MLLFFCLLVCFCHLNFNCTVFFFFQMLGKMHFINSSAFIDGVYGIKIDALGPISSYCRLPQTLQFGSQRLNVCFTDIGSRVIS